MFPSRVISGQAGQGLVAARDLKAGASVARFDGPIMPFADLPADEIRHAIWIGPDRWMIPTTSARFANHSCEPTCEVIVDDADELHLVTVCAVIEGGALTFDYGLVASLDPLDPESRWDPRWSFHCLCGSRGCRGLIDGYVVAGAA